MEVFLEAQRANRLTRLRHHGHSDRLSGVGIIVRTQRRWGLRAARSASVWDITTPLLEDTIWMMMKLIQMRKRRRGGGASLWVSLTRCETGGPWKLLSVQSPVKTCTLLGSHWGKVSQGARPVSRPKYHLKKRHYHQSEKAHYTREEGRWSQKGEWSGPHEVWLIGKGKVSKKKKREKETNCLNIPEYFAALV